MVENLQQCSSRLVHLPEYTNKSNIISVHRYNITDNSIRGLLRLECTDSQPLPINSQYAWSDMAYPFRMPRLTCGREGNRGSGVVLILRHRLHGIFTYGLNSLQRRKMSTPLALFLYPECRTSAPVDICPQTPVPPKITITDICPRI